MKKVGFIDYYLDEWHAKRYPDLMKELSNGEYQVCYAYGKIDSPIGGKTNKEWAEEYGVELLDSIEEVIEKSDVLVVLSPDNPEMHEELTDLPLKSGKCVYVDKTFAPDKATAERIFAKAKKYNTPCFSSSALRFATELGEIDKSKIVRISSEGPDYFEKYVIHQVEPIVTLMQSRAKRVMGLGSLTHPSLIIEFEDGRYVQLRHGLETDFRFTVADEKNNEIHYFIKSSYFRLFVQAVLEFFETGKVPVSPEETIDVIAICSAGKEALLNPFKWIEL